MLKALFREVGRSLRSNRTPAAGGEPAASSPAVAIDLLTRQFKQADAAERQRMTQQLRAELASHLQDVERGCLLGDWLLELGQPEEAQQAYRRALQLQPLHARSHEGLGLSLLQLGQIEEAYLRLETASKLAPDNAEVWVHWGLVDLEFGNFARAGNKFQRAVERDHRNPHAWHNLALVSLKQGDLAASIEQFGRALALRPEHGLAHSNLALALLQADRLEEARQSAENATRLKSGNARVWVVLAEVLLASGREAEAEAALTQALAVDPRHVGSHIGLAKLCMNTRRFDAARDAFEQALRIDPQNADAQAGLGQLHLLLGEWASGWPLYEARRRTEASPVRTFPYLEWQGETSEAQVVLVHAEQGVGDIILFASCLADLQARAPRCVVEVPQRLQALFARSFAWAEVIGHEPADNAMAWLGEHGAIDRQVPIGSLPRWFRQRPEDFPTRTAYLQADPQRVAHWRTLIHDGDRPVIGIGWRGGLATTAKHQRSLPLQQLVEALAPTGARLVCLQHGDIDAELRACWQALGVDIHPGLSGYGDLDDLAALTSACDGVVTVCSTQAHMSGALGRPGLVLVPSNANWRYGAHGPRTPWYPSLTLARQDRAHDWREPLTAARDWVEALRSPERAR